MINNWRLLTYSIHEPAANMAIDEAILDAHLEGKVPPTLRLYGWEPPAVSIGYGQKLSTQLAERIRNRGFDIVRRQTGGRAVLHANELTYSFVGSSTSADGLNSGQNIEQGVLSSSILSAYKQICQGLILSFRRLGVELELGSSLTPYKDNHDCFLATTSADLHFQGKKLVGSAQLRRRHAVLQHGSILLNQPQDLMRSLLTGSESSSSVDEGDDAPARHANLFEILAEDVPISRLQDCLRCGFEEAFQTEFSLADALSPFEAALAEQYQSRYKQAVSAV